MSASPVMERDHAAEAYSGVLLDDRGDLDRPSVGGGVELGFHRPDRVRCVRFQCVGRGRGPGAFASGTHWVPGAFPSPQSLEPLVICDPVMSSGVKAFMVEPRIRRELDRCFSGRTNLTRSTTHLGGGQLRWIKQAARRGSEE